MALIFGLSATTVAYIAVGVAVASAAAGAYAAYSSAQAQQRAIDYQRKQQGIQAKQARDAAAAAAELAHDRNQRVLAAQRAALGGAGVSTTEGTSLILQMDAAQEAALEEGRIRAAGETAATGFASQGKLMRFQSQQVQRAGYIGAGTTLLGGTASAAGSYYGRSGTTGGSLGGSSYTSGSAAP